jgi:nitrous oxidase accessory protein NosD
MKTLKVLGIGLVVVLLSAGLSIAATICVNKTGDGGCYTTITNGVNAASSGDVVKVAPGRYEESVVINKFITLEGAGPDKTTIYNNSGMAVRIGSSASVNAEVRGFTITGMTYGVYVGDTSANSTAIIRNNYIVGCGSTGIAVANYENSTIINNVIAYNNSHGVTIGYHGSLAIFNNIIAFNNGWGVLDATTTSYNNVSDNASGNFNITKGQGDISLNPKFVDAAAGNYQLASDSPSRSAGRPIADDNDPDGTRNDQGAYGGPFAASFWPYPTGGPVITELSVTPSSVPQGGTITIRATGEIR